MGYGRSASLSVVLLAGTLAAAQKLEVNPGHTVSRQAPAALLLSAGSDLAVSVRARLVQADSNPAHDGSLVLVSIFEHPQRRGHFRLPGIYDQRLILVVPLSSATDAYGEARSCTTTRGGQAVFRFTAGLDEKNFVPFSAMERGRDFQFSLNKYLCRALAAAFRCKSFVSSPQEVHMQADMGSWKLTQAFVELHSKIASASAEAEPAKVTSTGKPFDYTRCSVVAPSNGLCCVQHKTTEWHCGGKPSGAGWHQVSGDCYHRETGGACTE